MALSGMNVQKNGGSMSDSSELLSRTRRIVEGWWNLRERERRAEAKTKTKERHQQEGGRAKAEANSEDRCLMTRRVKPGAGRPDASQADATPPCRPDVDVAASLRVLLSGGKPEHRRAEFVEKGKEHIRRVAGKEREAGCG